MCYPSRQLPSSLTFLDSRYINRKEEKRAFWFRYSTIRLIQFSRHFYTHKLFYSFEVFLLIFVVQLYLSEEFQAFKSRMRIPLMLFLFVAFLAIHGHHHNGSALRKAFTPICNLYHWLTSTLKQKLTRAPPLTTL